MAEVGLESRTSFQKSVKTTGQCMPTRMAIIKICKILSVGEDIEKLEPSCIACSQWHGSYGKYLCIPKQVKYRITTPKYIPQGIENKDLNRCSKQHYS